MTYIIKFYILASLGRTEESLNYINKAILLDHFCEAWKLLRAFYFGHIVRYKEAIEAYAEILSRNPTSEEALTEKTYIMQNFLN